MAQAIFEWERRQPNYGRFSKGVQAKRKKKGIFCCFEPSLGQMLFS